MRLEELKVYRLSMDIGERVWNIVIKWDYFARDTLGKQWIRAVDSMAANLSEGYGRLHFKENKQFSYYSRGSLYETKTWTVKARNRNLITEEESNAIMRDLESIAVKLNNYVQSMGKQKTPQPMTPQANDGEAK